MLKLVDLLYSFFILRYEVSMHFQPLDDVTDSGIDWNIEILATSFFLVMRYTSAGLVGKLVSGKQPKRIRCLFINSNPRPTP